MRGTAMLGLVALAVFALPLGAQTIDKANIDEDALARRVMAETVVGVGAPPNDLCVNAIPIAVPSLTAGTTIGAGDDAPGFCGTTANSPSVWYTVVGTGNTITVTTCEDFGGGADYDTKASVYCDNCGFTCVGGNDDSCPSSALHSTFSFCSAPSTTYDVMVHGFGGQSGNFDLNVFDDGNPCMPTVQCTPIPVELQSIGIQ
ncbi:MAG: hypothetical protein OES32_12355 [Acidobacteriota bacterium]|nr:hypothetical protein [Acidobacteriota bacterium]MDH3524367.1 hypothetical protein [Acidobacteriota bacterium]